MTKIFISYRRSDSEGYVGRLYDHLALAVAQSEIFMDVANIEPGVDFTQVIDDAVGQCNVLIAVIGPTWETVTNGDGNKRLNDENDFVRLEIETALKRDIAVIPVLVGRSQLPIQSEIPVSLHPLLARNGVELRHKSFSYDVEQLAKTVRRNLQLNSVSPEIKHLIGELGEKVDIFARHWNEILELQKMTKRLSEREDSVEQYEELMGRLAELKDSSPHVLHQMRDFQQHLENLELLVRHIPDDETIGQLRAILPEYARMVRHSEDMLISFLFPRGGM